MKKEIFVIGANQKLPRHYSMTFLKPMDGMRLALKLAKILANAPAEALDINDGTQLHDILKSLLALIQTIDSDELISMLENVLAKTSVYAKTDAAQDQKHLSSGNGFNEWFEDHRSDLFIFAKEIIWRNASPFLPTENLVAQSKSGQTSI